MVEKTMEQNKDERVRTEILQAAERVFQKWGLNKATMEDIASEAGKGKSTLYYYYESKDAIFDAVVRQEVDHLLSTARESALTGKTAKEKIKLYIVTLMMEMKHFLVLYAIVRREIRGDQKVIQKLRRIFQDKEEAFVKDILLEGIRSGEFSFINEGELALFTKTIIGIIHSLELHFGLESDDVDQIEIAARLISNGI